MKIRVAAVALMGFLVILPDMSLAQNQYYSESIKISIREELPIRNEKVKELPVKLHRCVNQKFGIAFACDPRWKFSSDQRRLTITISESPKVMIVFDDRDQGVKFMSEVSRSALSMTGRYAPGFDVERSYKCSRELVKVKSYLKDNLNIRITDYYLMSSDGIHTVFFLVDPRDQFEKYQFLLKEIADYVVFLQPSGKGLRLTQLRETKCEELVAE